ncbi:MAG: hypothetical protein ABEJ69_01005, partial [Candidatus Nanohaloarchaea archaeon]
MKHKIFHFTPLGRADRQLREYIGEVEDGAMSRYEQELSRYRNAKLVQLSLLVLLYAGLITSIAATIGFGLTGPAKLVEKVASYFGTGIIFIIYVFSRYFTMLYRESYHVQREILLHR